MPSFRALLLTFSGLLALAACSGGEAKYPTGADRAATGSDIYAEEPSIFGAKGLNIFGRSKEEGETGIGVNSYLWRASLDTVSFMPLASADPFGGVITTDWYTSSSMPNERVKVNILILNKKLRSDGVRASVFRQVLTTNGTWQDAEPGENTARALEDAILTRARELKVGDL